MRSTLLLLLLLCGMGCKSDKRGPSSQRPRPVKSMVIRDASQVEHTFAGLSTPDDAVTLAFKTSGQLLEIPVSKGQQINRGELIAALDPKEAELQVETTRTLFEEASSQLERMRRLLAHEAISVQEFEVAKSRYAQAHSNYESAQTQLREMKLLAPFSGVIESTFVDAFERVAAGQAIARLVNPITTTVSFTLPEGMLPLLESPTTHFEVRFDSFPDQIFEAEVKNFARTSSDASGFPTSLKLSSEESKRFGISPGMSCTILMQSRAAQQGAVVVPLSAVYAPSQGGEYLWVITPEMRVELRRVRLGALVQKGEVIVEEGVRSGERIVTAGVYRLQAGDQVELIHSTKP
uniref:efflux RND transporter periplasmic adaptor subunit n=1 Tax=Alistipes sp. TaxID=1872444 RepID=UPI004055AAE6